LDPAKQTPRKGTTRKSISHKRPRATRFQRHQASRGTDQILNSTGLKPNQIPPKFHRPRAKPNRTTLLHYLTHGPGQARAKTLAQSASQGPITIPVNVEIAPAHSYTGFQDGPGHRARLACSSSRQAQAGQEAKHRLAQAALGLHNTSNEGIGLYHNHLWQGRSKARKVLAQVEA
jgi:hypothetical protein